MIRKLKTKIKQLILKLLQPIIKKVVQGVNNNKTVEYMIANLSHQTLKRPYIDDEKIDIVFLFQAASFWSSWESVWNVCNEDDRFNPIMLVCDDSLKEKTQFITAQSFLKNKNIPFNHISEVNLSDINPHIVVLHTPYDGHRPKYLHANMLSSKGYRIVYITYGIEISDINKARNDHFKGNVTTNAWRVYTFSKEMIKDYKFYSPTGGDMVRSFGHPKFDYLNKKCFPSLPEDIKEQANDKKVVLWKVHFPKEVDGKLITPSLEMYEELLQNIESYSELFFIFMPHPKFYEQLSVLGDAEKFKEEINSKKNLVEFTNDDYRPVLMNCDYYMIDRSAIMVEAGVTGKPILYISAKEAEAMTEPIQKIVDSYYQACEFSEIKTFLDDIVVASTDPLKENRLEVFKSVIPTIDGKSGYKIKEDMKNTLINESKQNFHNLVQ
jgi:hypothetical protein